HTTSPRDSKQHGSNLPPLRLPARISGAASTYLPVVADNAPSGCLLGCRVGAQTLGHRGLAASECRGARRQFKHCNVRPHSRHHISARLKVVKPARKPSSTPASPAAVRYSAMPPPPRFEGRTGTRDVLTGGNHKRLCSSALCAGPVP